jgi:DeoR family transcriptional regulator of aga operon
MESAEERSDIALPAEVRLSRIQQVLEQRSFVRVRDLSERFGVSTVTIRHDLGVLEDRQLAFRVHGGAVPFATGRGERTFEEVAARQTEQKSAIAELAASMVSNGETIVIDVGTTAASFAQALVDRTDLTELAVITNGIKIALILEDAHPRFTIVVTGGTLRPKQHSLVEPLATTLLEALRFDTVFLGCNGIDSESGVTNVNLPEAAVKRAMIGAAARVVVIADGTKIGVRALAPVCGLDEIDVLITDASADTNELDAVRRQGIDVVVA